MNFILKKDYLILALLTTDEMSQCRELYPANWLRFVADFTTDFE